MQLCLEKETESCGQWKQTKETHWIAVPVLMVGCKLQFCQNNGVFNLGHILYNTFFLKDGV